MFTICILFPTQTPKNTLVYVKRHQDNPQTPKILPHWDHAHGFVIPGSATVLDLKVTDFDHA